MTSQSNHSSESSRKDKDGPTRRHFTNLVGAYAHTRDWFIRRGFVWGYCWNYLGRTPKQAKDFLTFFVLQGAQFLVVVVNNRAFNHLQYVWAASTDAAFCLLSWTIWKKIAEAEGVWAKMGYVAGGTTGSLLGMWLTRMWG